MRRNLSLRLLFLPLVLFLSVVFGSPETPPEQQPLLETLHWVRSTPRTLLQYGYFMTVRLHLLFFWAAKDDVGGGYTRRGVSSENARQEFFQVLSAATRKRLREPLTAGAPAPKLPGTRIPYLRRLARTTS